MLASPIYTENKSFNCPFFSCKNLAWFKTFGSLTTELHFTVKRPVGVIDDIVGVGRFG